MDTVLLINKPAGMTSFDVVARCRRVLHERKAGHTGTLDPEASGLLIVLTGKYTKYLPYCVHHHKQYAAEFRLGMKSDTEDIWGNVTETGLKALHSETEMQALADRMTGRYMQIPPMYSALKKDGRKLYEYARKGIEVEREPRECHIDFLRVQKLSEDHWALQATVSSGTYIRTLITDLAALAGEDAVMSALVRTGIENLTLEEAVSLDSLSLEQIPSFDIARILNPELPLVEVPDPLPIYRGQAVSLPRDDEIVILCYNKQILAAYEHRDDGLYHCRRGLF